MTSTPTAHTPTPKHTLINASLAALAAGLAVHTGTLHRKLATARRDPLTGLHSRTTFTNRATTLTSRHNQTAMVLICDIDHFKQINDHYGHAAGDRVLVVTAQRLTNWAGPRSVISRLGGDEFALATKIQPSQRHTRLNHLATTLARPIDIGGHRLDITVSVGAATPDLIDTTDLSQMLRAADTAMYAGKHTAKPQLADHSHTTVPSINGRRAGRPGTHTLGTTA